MKELNKENYYKVIELFEEIEDILRNTKLDDEHILVNNIRSFIRLRFQSEVFSKLPNPKINFKDTSSKQSLGESDVSNDQNQVEGKETTSVSLSRCSFENRKVTDAN